MTTDVVSLAPETPVDAAAWRLATDRVSGAPVRDRAGAVVGVLSRSDLAAPGRAGASGEGTVGDVMTPAVWSVRSSAPALDVVELMVDKGIHRVVVVDRPGQVEGIVTAMDILRALARGERFEPDQGEEARASLEVAEVRR